MAEAVWRKGHVVWREHVSPDTARARAFYGALFGWEFAEQPMPDGVYTYIRIGEQGIGGIYPMEGVPPHWAVYVSVPDLDAAVAAATASGGGVLKGPDAIPGIGRFAILVDPAGAHVTAFWNQSGDPPAPGMPPVGTFCWETLNSANAAGIDGFYRAVFGWEPQEFGPGMKVYNAGGVGVASLQQTPPGVPSHYVSHVAVSDAIAVRDKAVALGGKVCAPEIPIPGIGRIAIIEDPLGAVLSLFEPEPPVASG